MPTARSPFADAPRPMETPVSFASPHGLADAARAQGAPFVALPAPSSRPPQVAAGPSRPPAIHAPFDVPAAGRSSLEAIAAELQRVEAARDAEAARKRFYATAAALATVLVLLILFGLRATRH